ncbi:uncharacterized protein LOC133890143 [Phragmites australis]|uniref:uncharacterized protein LOC133890143 n=1 Tax=Phragmites australis TaxID=29695 RepID=UPI002D78ED87|nr:uncharacterized protein LOC133890143 [Phragmites australis]
MPVLLDTSPESSPVSSSHHALQRGSDCGCGTVGEGEESQGGRGELQEICAAGEMFDDQDLGFFANFLGIFIFVVVIAYHFVMADPKYEGN